MDEEMENEALEVPEYDEAEEGNIPDEQENDEQQEENKAPDEKQEEAVPLKKYLAMKEKYKKLEEEYNDSKFNEELVAYKKELKTKYTAKGYDPELAEMLADDMASLKVQIKGISSEDKSIDKLAESDPLYKNAKDWETDIRKAMKKDKTLTAELAYIKVRGGLSALRKEVGVDQMLKNEQKTPSDKQPKSSNGGSGSGSMSKLDPVDRAALKNLQKYQPDKKWTVEKYLKLKGN